MLRKSPTRTEAFLAANRRNALKSTGPRTARGKAWSCMNNLKHGRYCKRLPEKLAAAGDHGGAALYQKVRGEIGTAFEANPEKPQHTQRLDEMTMNVWLLARSAGVNGLKPRSTLLSRRLGPMHQRLLLFRMQDRQRGIRISYWVQRKRYWNQARMREVLKTGRYPADAPTLGEILESKLRHRVFRPGRYSRLMPLQRMLLSLYEEANRANPANLANLGNLAGPAGPGGRTGNWEQGTGNGSRVGTEGTKPGHHVGSQGQADGPSEAAPAKSGGLRSILTGLWARLLGGS